MVVTVLLIIGMAETRTCVEEIFCFTATYENNYLR